MGQTMTRDAMEGWQPIDTAPKDGTDFLSWHEERGMEVVFWYEDKNSCCPDGWAIQDGPILPVTHISHWRPLPAPPASANGGQS